MSPVSPRTFVVAAALAIVSVASHSATVDLAADGQWHPFVVDRYSAVSGGLEWISADYSLDPDFGSALSFTFTIGAGEVGQLTVVDASFAGDTYQVFNQGALIGATSAVPQLDIGTAPDVGYDYDAALLNSAFSRGVYTLGAGTYQITGALQQALLVPDENNVLVPSTSAAGAVRLTVSAVPEPSALSMALAAVGLIWMLSRRRRAR